MTSWLLPPCWLPLPAASQKLLPDASAARAGSGLLAAAMLSADGRLAWPAPGLSFMPCICFSTGPAASAAQMQLVRHACCSMTCASYSGAAVMQRYCHFKVEIYPLSAGTGTWHDQPRCKQAFAAAVLSASLSEPSRILARSSIILTPKCTRRLIRCRAPPACNCTSCPCTPSACCR